MWKGIQPVPASDPPISRYLRAIVRDLFGAQSVLRDHRGRPMTPRQEEILAVITGIRERTGISPTIREIARAVGLRSTSTVSEHVRNLEQLGELERNPGYPRSLRPVNNMTCCSECDRPLTATGRYCSHCGVQL